MGSKTAADELAALLERPETETERVERQARAVEGWVRRILSAAAGDEYDRDDAEVVGRVYDTLAGTRTVKRARALFVVERWLANRATASLDVLATALAQVDAELGAFEQALLTEEKAEVRGTAKRPGRKWDAERVTALLCHRVGALGFRRIAGPIDGKALKQSAEDLAADRAGLGDWVTR